ncbi:hypothetical protein NEMIN01_2499 [Nematocida minor]|uniref:uncharacterized protein n=1 Tax=Nematocida minor TaxID=1912983 RepID=UPI002220DA4C|nr:uncharacterized protein NEMIN01_2499 [Nematocida minor]KAI5193360.1 hypothetical protein NEMIN01_2499 [Nematocida minor]
MHLFKFVCTLRSEPAPAAACCHKANTEQIDAQQWCHTPVFGLFPLLAHIQARLEIEFMAHLFCKGEGLRHTNSWYWQRATKLVSIPKLYLLINYCTDTLANRALQLTRAHTANEAASAQ